MFRLILTTAIIALIALGVSVASAATGHRAIGGPTLWLWLGLGFLAGMWLLVLLYAFAPRGRAKYDFPAGWEPPPHVLRSGEVHRVSYGERGDRCSCGWSTYPPGRSRWRRFLDWVVE